MANRELHHHQGHDLRKAAERTIHGLWNAIGRILNLYSQQECANYFANNGYDAEVVSLVVV